MKHFKPSIPLPSPDANSCPRSWLFNGTFGLSFLTLALRALSKSIKWLLNHPRLRFVQCSFIGFVYLVCVKTCVRTCMCVLNWRCRQAAPTAASVLASWGKLCGGGPLGCPRGELCPRQFQWSPDPLACLCSKGISHVKFYKCSFP